MNPYNQNFVANSMHTEYSEIYSSSDADSKLNLTFEFINKLPKPKFEEMSEDMVAVSHVLALFAIIIVPFMI